MKLSRAGAISSFLMCFLGWVAAPLAAQDVKVSPLEWAETKDAPDELPQFKDKVAIKFPAELKATPDIGYVILEFNLDEKGRSLGGRVAGTQPLLERLVFDELANRQFKPGRRAGEAVYTNTWLSVIFNPATAAATIPDATPRLLEVAMAEIKLPKKSKAALEQSTPNQVIWADVTVTSEGRIAAVKNVPPELIRALEIAAKNWRFEPARRGGAAVEVEARVPFVVSVQQSEDDLPGKRTQPRVKSQTRPVYPMAMRMNGMKGEVLVDFRVDREGRVRNAYVARSLNPSFDDAAIDAVKKWRFEPGRIGERPVVTHMLVPIVFELEGIDGTGPLTERGKQDLSKLPEQFRYDTPPKPVGTAWPVYPYELLRDNKKGRASVVYVVGSKGRVAEIVAVEASHPEFGRALVASLETFVHEPAIKAGRPSLALQRYTQDFERDAYGVIGGGSDRYLLEREAKKPERIFGLRDLDEPLKPLSRKPPVFPISAAKDVEAGEALIEFLVDEEGRARLPRIVSATDDAFAYAAMQAIASWRFEPPMRGGRAVVARVQVPLLFGPAKSESPPAAKP